MSFHINIKDLPKYGILLVLLNFATTTQADSFEECVGYKTSTFVASPSGCNKFIYCDGNDSQEGACPDGLHFDRAEATCTWPEEANCRVTNVREDCPAVDNINEIILVGSKQSCGVYYLCQNGQGIELRCTDHLHFNANTGKCDFPENVRCLIEQPNATVCGPTTTDSFPHSKDCNYFYSCTKGFLTLQQCPFSYGWDVVRRSCTIMSQAKCFNK